MIDFGAFCDELSKLACVHVRVKAAFFGVPAPVSSVGPPPQKYMRNDPMAPPPNRMVAHGVATDANTANTAKPVSFMGARLPSSGLVGTLRGAMTGPSARGSTMSAVARRASTTSPQISVGR